MRPRRRLLKNDLVADVTQRRSKGVVELWAMDEHRVGLKPILRRVWARRGKRPQAVVRPRYEWLYVYAFVCPETGETEFWLVPSANTESFQRVLAAFLRGRSASVLLVLDQAGWHIANDIKAMERDQELALKYLPSHSPELQPAERLWTLVDEPLVNEVFESLAQLEAALAERCVALTNEPDRIRGLTLYHWWPGGADHPVSV